MESKIVQQATERISCILDALYGNANLVEVIKKHGCHLSRDRHGEILKLLLPFGNIFYGTLGEFHTSPVYLDLNKGAVPKNHDPFP